MLRPHLAERTRNAAEAVLRHEVDLLGSGPVVLGPTIDWHTDFRSGHTWPHTPLGESIETLLIDQPCDIKVVWELSRCHQWVTLGRAYADTADARYAHEFVAQLDSWLRANRYPCGVNWSRAMEAALRAINWYWAATLFDAAPAFDATMRLRLLKALRPARPLHRRQPRILGQQRQPLPVERGRPALPRRVAARAARSGELAAQGPGDRVG